MPYLRWLLARHGWGKIPTLLMEIIMQKIDGALPREVLGATPSFFRLPPVESLQDIRARGHRATGGLPSP